MDRSADQSTVCFRCDNPLDGAHWIRLLTAHQGEHAEGYSDVETRVCPDCLAAMGLLEFEPQDQTPAAGSRTVRSGDVDPTTDDATDESPLSQYARLAPLRSLHGDN